MFLQLTFFGPLATQYIPPCSTTFSAMVASFWCRVASVNRQKRYEGAIFVNTKDRQFVLGRFVLFKKEIKNFTSVAL